MTLLSHSYKCVSKVSNVPKLNVREILKFLLSLYNCISLELLTAKCSMCLKCECCGRRYKPLVTRELARSFVYVSLSPLATPSHLARAININISRNVIIMLCRYFYNAYTVTFHTNLPYLLLSIDSNIQRLKVTRRDQKHQR